MGRFVRFFRRGVCTSALVLVVCFGASFIAMPEVTFELYPEEHFENRTQRILHLSQGRLVYSKEADFMFLPMCFTLSQLQEALAKLDRGWDLEVGTASYAREEQVGWWQKPWIHRGAYQRAQLESFVIPLGWIGLVLSALALWLLWVGRNRVGVGCCDCCGYSLEGLDGQTCPECGVQRG